MNVTVSFRGEKWFLSNFYPVDIVYDDMIYPSVEHAYQASKSDDIAYRRKIQSLPSASKAKFEGSKVKLRAGWDEWKLPTMKLLVEQKFTIPCLHNKLIETGNEELVEYNYWHDNYWGACTCKLCKGMKKFNKLGEILMEIRERAKSLPDA